MTTREEALANGRELYHEIFGSKLCGIAQDLLEEGDSQLDHVLYAIFSDAVKEGIVIPIDIPEQMVADLGEYADGSPLYGLTAIKLRNLMCAALTVGMWHQKVTNNLETMWLNGVDKKAESE